MRNSPLILAVACAATAAQAQFLSELSRPTPVTNVMTIVGGNVQANRYTGAFAATGNVYATQSPYRFWSNSVSHGTNGVYDLGSDLELTTCTNGTDHLHWRITSKSPFPAYVPNGTIRYYDHKRENPESPWYLAFQDEKGLLIKNAWLLFGETPVFWIPYWYHPLDTNYGWRFLPGYCSRWGGYLLGGYVYDIVNEGVPDAYSLGGGTYADIRTENGLAVGQSFRWNLKDFGKGKIRAWYGWDDDYDRYDNHWNDHKRNWKNWGSEVDRERYRLHFEHAADVTERDAIRAQADFLSDSHVLSDFFNRGPYHYETHPVNEVWYEHRENSWASGVSVSGPVNDYYGSVARLPEGWLMVEPQPIFDWPVNYESETRVGYLNRTPGETASADPVFRYRPSLGESGKGADYQAVRADTYHRISAPMKFEDVLSFVPRASYRATHWTDSGSEASGYMSASGDAITRHIAEFGFQVSARAKGWLDDEWRHVFEPYLDYSFQDVSLTGNGSRNRYYAFDAYDRSTEWLDQFGFEGRGLTCNWHGIRPGFRNFFQRFDERTGLRTVLDTDVYAAIPFIDEGYVSDRDLRHAGTFRGYAREPEDGNYSRRECVVPGFRVRYTPNEKTSVSARMEYDCDNEKVAYADLMLRHHITDTFAWYVGYTGRDYRIWDYVGVRPDRQYENGTSDRYNYELDNLLSIGFEHDVCDWFHWSPFIRHDCRRNESEEVGVWFDFLTDCLGYRVEFSHRDACRRIDGSTYESDTNVAFFIYLRAFGPGSVLDLVKF